MNDGYTKTDEKTLHEEFVRKIERANIANIVSKLPINQDLFNIEYNLAINDGHPEPKDAKEYVTDKIKRDQIEHYIKLKGNGIKYKF